MTSKITKEAFERCKQLTLAEQLEAWKEQTRQEFAALKTDLRTVAMVAYETKDRVDSLEHRL